MEGKPFKLPTMPNYRAFRVRSRTLAKVGLDYLGPVSIKIRVTKRWVALFIFIYSFICFTRSMHLELDSFSAESFLSVFKRFVSRRGCPAIILMTMRVNFSQFSIP